MDSNVLKNSIAAGKWKPNIYLTNVGLAYFQKEDTFAATKLFPIVPVDLVSSFFYKFSKGDLARDDMQRKPAFGHVAPAQIGTTDEFYNCKVDQIILGIDQLSAEHYRRTGAPGAADPRVAKVRAAVEKAKLHMDNSFANTYFRAGAWANEKEGVASSPSTNQFLQFDNSSADPVQFLDEMKMEILQNGRREPNKIGLGAEAFIALKNNPCIIDRIKYSGSTANPAIVNENVLAQLFGVEEVVVFRSTYNAAGVGEADDMKFVCDPKGMLLCYSPQFPQIDEPAAGYTFAWNIPGANGYMAFTEYEGEKADHAEFIEGLVAYDMKQVGSDLAVYLKTCCS